MSEWLFDPVHCRRQATDGESTGFLYVTEGAIMHHKLHPERKAYHASAITNMMHYFCV